MKQSVNPAVFVVAIVVVIVIACVIGFRALNPPNASSNLSPTDYKAKQEENAKKQQANMASAQTHAPGGAPAQYQEYMKRQAAQRQAGQH